MIAAFTPISARDDYTFETPAREQVELVRKALTGRTIEAVFISMESYWVETTWKKDATRHGSAPRRQSTSSPRS